MNPPQLQRLKPWIPLLFALGVIALVFAPTVGFGFVNWDDYLHIWTNPAVNVQDTTTARDLLLTPDLGYPIPVTALSNRIEFALVGESPWLYHLDNLLLHLAACALLFALARKLNLDPIPAACAVLLFGLHPSVAEPVSWVSGRKDLLALLFALASMLALLHEPEDAPPSRRLLPDALFALALLAKPVAIFVLPLQALTLLKLRGPRAALRRLISPVLVAAAIVPLAFLGQSERGALESTPLLLLLRKAWFALGYHLSLVTTVQAPCVKHFPPDLTQTLDLLIDPLPLLLLPLLALVFARVTPREHRDTAAFGLAWAALAYLPNSSLIPLVRFIADTYIHAPLVGLALFAAATLQRLTLLKHRLAPLLLLGIAAPLALLAFTSSSMWRDDTALWGTAFERYQGQNPDVCMAYGAALVKNQRYARALHVYQTCEAHQQDARYLKNIALMRFYTGDLPGAQQLLQQLQQRNPADPVLQRYLALIEQQLQTQTP